MVASAPPDVDTVEIRPEPMGVFAMLGELWRYRELFWVLTARDIKVRYKQTVFGVAWALFQPLISMVLFSIVFGRLANLPSDGVAYPIFVYAGILPWTFFSTSLTSAANALLNVSGLLTKVYFPRLLVPIAPLGAHLVDFLIATVIVFGLMAYYAIAPTLRLLAFPLLLVVLTLLAIGTGAMLSAVLVRFRDVRILLPYGIQVLMFASPIVWAESLVPAAWRPFVALNPVAGLISGFRAAILGQPFDLEAIGISTAVAVVIFFLGMNVFLRTERRAIDAL